ncbi:uncharacterized protein RNJ42_03421 [Nakaseomyces bracarensis]|uniref:uncharacterized protein n=1 Tax=Nakaseomyces bracarensis TaxID=273131 RepID=UPI0038710288
MSVRSLSRSQLKKALDVVRKVYPEAYADRKWDNTGLLIDSSVEEADDSAVKMLLTVDLTSSVAQEAVDNGCNVILAYHPFIFPNWNRLNPQSNTQHANAVKLIRNGVSVYCPHTAVDAVAGGVNDWLVKSVVNDDNSLIVSNKSIEQVSATLEKDEEDHEVGYGRFVKLSEPIAVADVVTNLKKWLGIEHMQVASLAYEREGKLSNHKVQSVAVCAGSGSGVFRNLNVNDVDLFVTGELSHHEVLKYKEMGKAIIVCNHTNTERGYVRNFMADSIKKQDSEGIFSDIVISKTDRDPLNTV